MRCNVAFLSGLPTPTCRKPYIYISGDVPVPIARYTSITNIDTCADHCDSKSNCCSFEFRQKERKCNINMECKPTGPVHVQVHDQIFCGKHFLIILSRLKFNLDLVPTPHPFFNPIRQTGGVSLCPKPYIYNAGDIPGNGTVETRV